MDFTSITFLSYILLTALAYRFAPRRLRALVLLLSSCFFYYTNSQGFLLLLLGDAALVFCVTRLLYKSKRFRFALTCGTAAFLVGTLILFKGSYLLSGPWLPGTWARQFLIPLGVSYYTFKLLGYLIDVYWRAIEPETNFIDFAAYVSFFPQIVAGPIQRSEQLLPQLHSSKTTTPTMVLLGSQRILLGFFKKFVVADNIGILVDFIYQHLHTAGQPVLWAFYGYPLQMYADFSGLTDIAIGAALIFGIASPENFEAPFSAPSPSEYWRRWHITLTTWLTDYVFTPIRMATRELGRLGLVLSLTINMVLIGLWHGFRWTFVLFGLVHALYLSVDALTSKARRTYYKQHAWAKSFATMIGPITTFHLIAVAFVFFRARTWQDVVFVLSHLFKGLMVWSPQFTEFMSGNARAILVGFCGYGVAELFDWLRRRNARVAFLNSLPRWGRWSVYSCSAIAVCFLVMLLLVNGEKRSPFLYAIF